MFIEDLKAIVRLLTKCYLHKYIFSQKVTKKVQLMNN